MELSVFIAKLLGIYLLIVALLWAVRGEVISQTIKDFADSRVAVLASGLMALVVGIALVISHNIWELNWRGLITVMGYLAISKGIIRIGWPQLPQKASPLLIKPAVVWVWIGLALALGGYLTWSGFTQGTVIEN